MNMDLISAGPPEPEIVLQQAFRDYESILSDEQKIQFHTEGRPDAQAAITLTALVDRQRNDNRRQCMGPRLMLFLESVQKFSEVADTFVSSHPQLAALVWGGVKTTILAANNVTSYFDKLSTLFMNLGKECPRMQGFGALYSSKGLEAALLEYSAAVIRLCKQIMESLRQPGYAQWSRALFISFEAQFRPHQAEIARLSQVIRDEASIGSQRAQIRESEIQAKERRANRKSLLKLQTSHDRTSEAIRAERLEVLRWRLEVNKSKALNSLSNYDYQTTYRRIRKEAVPGTCQWALEDPGFCDWIAGDSRTLWLTGKLGAGKSVISARVVAHLLETLPSEDSCSFFFCRFDDMESMKAKTVVQCITKQLLCDLPSKDFQVYKHGQPIEFVRNQLKRTSRYFVVLDGLDDCEELQMKEITETLLDLLASPHLQLKILISSRPAVPSWFLKKFPAEKRIDLESSTAKTKVNGDIQEFIRIMLENSLTGEEPELQIGDPLTILRIRDILEQKANGMFLWVKLQLETLRKVSTDAQIISVLNDLPEDLPRTFNRILLQHAKKGDEDVKSRIFRWTAVAKRPLTIQELREAISIRPLQEIWEPHSLINSVKKAISDCGNLLLIDEELQTVHFAHSSVKQHLLSPAAKESMGQHFINVEDANKDAGAICVSFLNLPYFNRQLARKAMRTNVDAAAVTSAVISDSLGSKQSANKLALRLLKCSRQLSTPIDNLFESTVNSMEGLSKENNRGDYLFEAYATRFWLEHLQNLIPDSEFRRRLWKLGLKLIEEAGWRNTLSNIPWTTQDWDERSDKVIDWIVQNAHISLAFSFLDCVPPSALAQLQKLAQAATSNGQLQILEEVLERAQITQTTLDWCLLRAAEQNDKVMTEKMFQKGTFDPLNITGALEEAAKRGNSTQIELLLELGIDMDARIFKHFELLDNAIEKGNCKTIARFNETGAIVKLLLPSSENRVILAYLLLLASQKRQTDVVKMLSKAGAHMDIFKIDASLVLEEAYRRQRSQVVEILLKAGADTHPQLRFSSIAKDLAFERGFSDLVKALLESGHVDMNTISRSGNTVLQYAAARGDRDVVETLLKAGAHTNAYVPGKFNCAALPYAAEKTDLDVVEVLLKAGINVDSLDQDGSTALHYAAQRGHLEIVKVLLKVGAEVDTLDELESTALRYAAEGGHGDVVDILLKAGANVDTSDRYEVTTLHYAAEGGHADVVKILLKAGANINATKGWRQNSLHLAAEGGYPDVVDLLLKAGADINTTDGYKRSSLYLAIKGGHPDVVKVLLNAGANINTSCGDRSALQYAAQEGHRDVVKELLKSGANIDASNRYGYTALHYAVRGGYLDIVELLLKSGANIDASNRYGYTALHQAAREGHLDVVEALLKAGADTNAVYSHDMNRSTALRMAIKTGHKKVAAALRAAGARE